jgi:hypothetical protein
VIKANAQFWQGAGLEVQTLEKLTSTETPLLLVWSTLQVASWPSLVILEGLLAYLVYRRLVAPARASLEVFARNWWRACLWGFAAISIGMIVLGVLPAVLFATALSVAITAYLLLTPGLLARNELRAGVHRSHWHPVCPECGYSLRRLGSQRCPECGETLPTTSRVYRRWAWRRLPWDRRTRGGLLLAYIKSLLLIVCRPGRAAQGLVLPDRLPRAVRWALAHLVLLAALRGGLVPAKLWLEARWQRSVGGSLMLLGDMPDYESSPGITVLWAAQTGAAWLAALGILPAIGVLLPAVLPGWHPAARRSAAKWSLYATVVAVLGHLALLGALAISRSQQLPPMGWPEYADNMLAISRVHPPGLMLAVPYGVWWAAGVAANPYLRRRGVGVFVGYTALFYVAWFIVARFAFPPGGLWGLL